MERLSHGSLKAVVLGSYERGDRALSVNRAIEIANLLGIPLHQLLMTPEPSPPAPSPARLLVDLRRARLLMEDPICSADPNLHILSNFVAWIATRRGDWNGEVMSLRQGDHATLALMAMSNEEEFSAWLAENRLLVKVSDHP